MISVAEWAEIRRLYKVEKLSKRTIARRLGVHRKTVSRALAAEAPPHYVRSGPDSVLEPYKPKIHALLAENPGLTGVRILEILREEGYPGQISILRDYLRQIRGHYKPNPVYVRMTYRPGEYGQVDWGEMPDSVLWQGQRCKVYAFVMALCYSRLLYVEFSLGITLWDFLRCHRHALEFFQGAPTCCVYDNLSSVVKRRRGTDITLNPTFQHFAGHYCFRVHACWPNEPHEKGVVERPMDYLVGNFWQGRHFADFDDLQRQGALWLNETANRRIHATLRQRPIDRFVQEQPQLVSLPPEPFDTCQMLYPKVSKDCVVRIETNDYSVPWPYARRPVVVQVDGCEIVISSQGQEIARYPRCYARHQQILDPTHYEGLWQSRAAASFAALVRGFQEAYGDTGHHFYMGLGRKTDQLRTALESILRLEQQYSHQEILAALDVAVQHGYFDPAAVHYLLRSAAWVPSPQTVTPLALDVAVEERELAVYDRLYGGGL